MDGRRRSIKIETFPRVQCTCVNSKSEDVMGVFRTNPTPTLGKYTRRNSATPPLNNFTGHSSGKHQTKTLTQTSETKCMISGHGCSSNPKPTVSRYSNLKLLPRRQSSRTCLPQRQTGSKSGARKTSISVPTRELYKVSFPCMSGCVNCAFSKCFGPVKVYVSQLQTPRQPCVREICDGQGRRIIPRARRKEFRGLVYDTETHSLYPPIPRGCHSVQLEVSKSRRVFY